MSTGAGSGAVAVSPEDFLFALAGSLVLVSLASGMARRGAGLSGAGPDFMATLFLAAVAMLGALVAAFSEWTPASHVLVAGTGSGALVAAGGASLRVARVRAAAALGEHGLRWSLLAAAVALVSFGWGAVAGADGQAAAGAPAGWVTAAVAAAATVAVGSAGLAVWRARPKPLVAAQLLGGVGALAGGMVIVAAGAVAVGSAVVMVGGGFVYSAARGGAREEPEAGDEPAPARARREPRPRPRRDAGVKVRVPKGSGSRVTRFRDDGLPPGGNG